jgi:putative hydrolase of the HAD superfamily
VRKYRSDFPRFIPPPTDETLLALQHARTAGFAICIVTNGGRDMQERKIASRLFEAVDGWVISEVIGVRKPDPRILVAAADRVRRQLTAEAWLIGDRAETDIWCAVQAGIRSAWITRGQLWDDRIPYLPTIQAASFGPAVERILAMR